MRNDNELSIGRIFSYFVIGFMTIMAVVGICWGAGAAGRVYDVWASRKEGEAEVAKAESNRSIKTLEAKAAMESSKHLAEAEIIRAHGVAEANRIIGTSLEGNESYLRYLWIHTLGESKNQVIYIPTEAGLPILEAKRGR